MNIGLTTNSTVISSSVCEPHCAGSIAIVKFVHSCTTTVMRCVSFCAPASYTYATTSSSGPRAPPPCPIPAAASCPVRSVLLTCAYSSTCIVYRAFRVGLGPVPQSDAYAYSPPPSTSSRLTKHALACENELSISPSVGPAMQASSRDGRVGGAAERHAAARPSADREVVEEKPQRGSVTKVLHEHRFAMLGVARVADREHRFGRIVYAVVGAGEHLSDPRPGPLVLSAVTRVRCIALSQKAPSARPARPVHPVRPVRVAPHVTTGRHEPEVSLTNAHDRGTRSVSGRLEAEA
eukprot:6176497-Pleurochrysis_carterae.AAC.2